VRKQIPWQALAVVVLAVLWLAYRWATVDPYETRVFDPGQEEIDVAEEELPVWADLPDLDLPEEPDLEGDLAEIRLERDRWRSEVAEVLKDVIADPYTGETTREGAQERLIGLTEKAGQEGKVERLLDSQGLGKAVCFLYSESAVVVMGGDSPEQDDLARIMDLVSGLTGLSWEAITVMGSGR